MAPTPVSIITGFLGSGKTTLILNLIPQLPKDYKIALLKNEFGNVEVDTQLASTTSISGVKELLNGCICCNLVGQLADALNSLRRDVACDRILIETSGSAFPATLAMEVSRLAESTGDFYLDGVIVVIDVENWKGYEDTSYTARMQAKYTDLIVFNKWELVDERRYEECLDRVGDLEVIVPYVKSVHGKVDRDILLGLDSAMVKNGVLSEPKPHAHDHQSEVEVLSVILSCEDSKQFVDLIALEGFLGIANKDEIYRIKAIMRTQSSEDGTDGGEIQALNWAFGRWTMTRLQNASTSLEQDGHRESAIVKMTIVFARCEAQKWAKRIEEGVWVRTMDTASRASLRIEQLK